MFFITYFTSSKAQNDNIVIEITGRLVNAHKFKPVPYANIINTKNGRITVSDSLGFFHFTLLKNDVLRISSIGYETRYLCFKDSIVYDSIISTIKLYKRIYALSEVDIYEARWEDFKFEFSHTELENDETRTRIEEWMHSIISIEELALITAAVSVGIPIPYKSKREKQLQRVKELKIIDAEEKIIDLKFNPEIVKIITGLEEDKIKDFMRFCKFDRKFLLRANDYDIITKIKTKFKMYNNRSNANFK